MNIKNMPEPTQVVHSRLSRSAKLEAGASTLGRNMPQKGRDMASTSVLARLVSRELMHSRAVSDQRDATSGLSASQLREARALDTQALPDAVIDTIFERMTLSAAWG